MGAPSARSSVRLAPVSVLVRQPIFVSVLLFGVVFAPDLSTVPGLVPAAQPYLSER